MQRRQDCIKCKGRFCEGMRKCPIMQKVRAQTNVNIKSKQEFQGQTPNVFVGRFGYPQVGVGILSTENYDQQDSPQEWKKQNKGIQEVINYRTQLINSNIKTEIKSFENKVVQMSQEVALSSKPADVEVQLNKKPNFKLTLNQMSAPHGPNVKLKKARFTENVKIDDRVEKVVEDDLLANEQIEKLSRRLDEHELTKIFSTGLLGKDNKLVPTRWSITAVDDTLGKQQIEKIKDLAVGDYELYMGSHLGNYYFCLSFPEKFRYELFEIMVDEGLSFSKDYETHRGRTAYAQNTSGGYYAARIAVTERQLKNKRQQGVLTLRFITDEYWAPLGVWVCREAARDAMNSDPIKFDDKETMLKFVAALVKKRWNTDANKLFKQSELLKEKTLADY